MKKLREIWFEEAKHFENKAWIGVDLATGPDQHVDFIVFNGEFRIIPSASIPVPFNEPLSDMDYIHPQRHHGHPLNPRGQK